MDASDRAKIGCGEMISHVVRRCCLYDDCADIRSAYLFKLLLKRVPFPSLQMRAAVSGAGGAGASARRGT